MDQRLLTALCGCCVPPAPPTPLEVTNRPGLTALAYRIGTFASFREAMLEAIARQPALLGLTTRQSDDPAITLLELWAAVADVLTFYQERIANEAFLRTAVERDSVLRLVRLLDYHLRPGMAATTRLAFTMDDGATVQIPVGLRVMSTPGQDERPQTFETVEAITADARLNRLAILPQPVAVNPFAQGRQTAFLSADNTGWQAAKRLMPADKVVLFHSATGTLALAGPAAPMGAVHTYGETLGWDVPPRVTAMPMLWGPHADVRRDLDFWAEFSQPVTVRTGAAPADPNAPEEKEIKEVRVEGDRFLLVWTTPIIKDVWPPDTEVRVFKLKMRVFGHDAPASLAKAVLGSTQQGSTTVTWTSVSLPAATLAVSGATLPLDAVYKDLVVGDELLVYEPNHPPQVVTVTGISEGEEILGADSLVAGAVSDHRHRATVSRVTVTPSVSITNRRNVNVYLLKGAAIPLWSGDFPDLITAGRLYLPVVRLDPDGNSVEIGRTISGRELKSGVALRLTDIAVGRTVLLADHTQQPITATLTARSVLPFAGQDFLVLDVTSLATIQLETRTAVLLGNVAQATHGETVRAEAIGSGDATVPFQRFPLRKAPLTYVPSARSARGDSTLRVLVNSVLWAEVSSLYGQPATATVYTARQTDEGTTLVQFGDGNTGARLPSGQGNVVATYRQGAGLAGRLQADQLNILLDRPVGLKAATNPASTEGGADPEALGQARQAAPTTVKTFGRAIALLDFAALATASGEVAKATATWVWRGLEKAVHLTVAGQEGGTFSPDALRRLHAGLTSQRDPNHTLLLANFCRVPIVVQATLRVDARFVRDDVCQAARQALLGFFAFEQVDFARPVHLSDVYRVLQDVAGVVSVDIDTLHFKGFSNWTAAQLAARGATSQPVQPHLRLFAARPRPGPLAPVDPAVSACFGTNPLPDVLPAEQAYIQVADTDVTLTATGGLA